MTTTSPAAPPTEATGGTPSVTVPRAGPGASLVVAEDRWRRRTFVLACLISAQVAGLAVTMTAGVFAAAAVVIAIGVAGAVVLSPSTRLEAGTHLFVFLLYTNALVVASRFHGVPQSVASFSVVLLVVPIVAYVFFQGRPIVVTPAFPLLLVYLAALCVSAAFARNVGSAASIVMLFLSEGLLLYILVSNAVRTAVTLRRVLWVIVAGSVLLSALSLWQELTGAHGNDFGGFAQVNEEALQVGEDLDGKVLRDRIGGPFGSPNRYAQILVVALPFALFLAIGERRRWLRLAAACSTVLILTGTFLTFSRGAAVALGFMTLFMLALRLLRLRQVLTFIVAFAAVIALAVPGYYERLLSLQGVGALASETGERPDGAIRGRFTSNLASWYVFLDNPIVGVGPLQYFAEYSREYANDLDLRFFETRRRAHNLYFEMAADTGIVGLTAFLAIPIVTGVQLRRTARFWRHRRPDLATLADALVVGLFAYYATGVFLHLSYQRYLWLLIGLANAGIWVLRPHDREPADNDAKSLLRVHSQQ